MASLFEPLPLPVLYLVTVVIILVSFEVGFRLGRRTSREHDGALGTFVGAGIGLLAFFLAFTFGMAGSKFDTRRELVLREANAIGTAYLRAQLLLPDSRAARIRELLRQYTDVRLEAARTGELALALARTEEIHQTMWSETAALGQSDPHSIVAGLLIESINEVIDLHEERVTAAVRSRIPERVWDVLLVLTVLVMVAVGYHAGQTSPRRSPIVLVLALAFSSVILVIADLNSPLSGSLRVSQEALIETRHGMK